MRENAGRRSVRFTGATALTGLTMLTALALGVGASVAQVGTQADAPRGVTGTPASAAPDVPEAPSVQVSPAATSAKAGTRTTARWSSAIDTGDQAAVNDAYLQAYAPKLTELIDWIGGSLLACLPGLPSLQTNAGTLSSLNFVRSMAGLAPVSFSSKLNSSAQKAALIMAANNSLSHHPSSSWKCWTSTGAKAAGKSNLALARPSLKVGQIIDLYMDDPGATNTAAGHRRWILNPFSTVMGTGSTRTANALTVIGPSIDARPNPRWVGWPTAGYFPNKLEPGGRWSLSSGLKSVSFASAKVSVYRGSTKLSVRKYAVKVGYGQPTVVWQMPRGFDKTQDYRVVVTGIKQAGVKKPLRADYTVRLFTPGR